MSKTMKNFDKLDKRNQQHNNKRRGRRRKVLKVEDRSVKLSAECDMNIKGSYCIKAIEGRGKLTKRYLLSLSTLLVKNHNFLSILLMLLIHKNTSDCLTINVQVVPSTVNYQHLQTSQLDMKQVRLIKRSTAAVDEKRSAKLQEEGALSYLQRYGYLSNITGVGGNANLISEESFNEAVMSFQRFAGIPETGSLDSLTERYMKLPRCGNKDYQNDHSESGRKRRRKKRYALQGSKWKRTELTYRISQYPSRFTHKKEQVDAQIEKAFKIWSQVAPIEFSAKKGDGKVHIDIRFASGEHGDGDPFDGPGNTLAHAYFPQYGGDAHFDDQEYWTVDSYAGTNIFQVAAHELGHSLGLGHSSVREALMAPFYQKYKPNFRLHADDILAIQALYGEKNEGDETPSASTQPPQLPVSPGKQPEQPASDGKRRTPTSSRPVEWPDTGRGGQAVDLCQEPAIDTITRTEDGNTYVFRGQYYWQLKESGIVAGYPVKISRDWDGLPGNLDAALTWSDGKTFFFKGDKYWRFFNKRREAGYPKLISSGFTGIPNNVDAAFVWGGNGKTYFFKKDKYWRFDSKQEPPVSAQYPKSLKNWLGLPEKGIDAAFKWDNGVTYFFKDDLYYRFDDRQFQVDTSLRPSFPRSSSEWWFGCKNSNLPVRRIPISVENSTQLLIAAASSNSMNEDLVGAKSMSDEGSLELASSKARGGHSSISRPIIESVSALFSSLFGKDEDVDEKGDLERKEKVSSTDSNSLDWSFHRGPSEETRRNFFKSNHHHHHHHHYANREPLNSNQQHVDTSRWTFPMSSSSSSGGREQSLSD